MPDTALLIIDMQSALLSDAYDVEACLGRVANLAERARPLACRSSTCDNGSMPCLLA